MDSQEFRSFLSRLRMGAKLLDKAQLLKARSVFKGRVSVGRAKGSKTTWPAGSLEEKIDNASRELAKIKRSLKKARKQNQRLGKRAIDGALELVLTRHALPTRLGKKVRAKASIYGYEEELRGSRPSIPRWLFELAAKK